MVLLSTEFGKRLTGETYRWPGLYKPEGENQFLRFLAFLLALAVVLVRQSIEAKHFFLFIRVRRKVCKQKVKERSEDDAFITVSDEDEGRGVILSVV